MASRLFVAHDDGPDAMRIEIFACFIEQRLRRRGFEAGEEAITQEPARRVAAIRIEAVANHRLAVAHHVGDEREDTHGHLAKVDVGVTNVRFDGYNGVADIDNAHGASFFVLLSTASSSEKRAC